MGFNFSINSTIRFSIMDNSSKSFGPVFPKIMLANASGSFNYTWNTTNTCGGIYLIEAIDLNWSKYNATKEINLTRTGTCINWTNLPPNITFIKVDDSFITSQKEIDLLSGTTTQVFCNVTVSDNNGYSDISAVNATFFYYLNDTSQGDENNVHYTNSSCTKTGNNSINMADFLCTFNVIYYANNGSWICNATAIDTKNNTAYGNDSAKINSLFAISVNSEIDFGNVRPNNESNEIIVNITNLGNVQFDLGLYAFARTYNDGLAMNCSQYDIGISLNNERYSLSSGNDFSSMNAVTGTITTLANFDLNKQMNQSFSIKQTYWKLQTPAGLSGICNGSLFFATVG
jgi:hypothetical protein